jgi:hypothetical protein
MIIDNERISQECEYCKEIKECESREMCNYSANKPWICDECYDGAITDASFHE